VRRLLDGWHILLLSDRRILAFEDGRVDLAHKDYRDGCNTVMSLKAEELLRRFLLHVLPKGSCAFDTLASSPIAVGASAWGRSAKPSVPTPRDRSQPPMHPLRVARQALSRDGARAAAPDACG